MADRAKNTPGMIGAAAAMGFIPGMYGVLAIALLSPESGIANGTLVSLLLPLATTAIGAVVGTLLTRSAAGASATRHSDWGHAKPA
jgi:hypothetical protein